MREKKENPISLLIDSSSAPNEKVKKKDDNKKGKNSLNDNMQGHPLKRSAEFEDVPQWQGDELWNP